jgi:hypothetical protein
MLKEDAAFANPQYTLDSMVLPAITDGKESWYGIQIDKTKFRIVLEDETEEGVYLKIVKKEKQ